MDFKYAFTLKNICSWDFMVILRTRVFEETSELTFESLTG